MTRFARINLDWAVDKPHAAGTNLLWCDRMDAIPEGHRTHVRVRTAMPEILLWATAALLGTAVIWKGSGLLERSSPPNRVAAARRIGRADPGYTAATDASGGLSRGEIDCVPARACGRCDAAGTLARGSVRRA